MKIKSIILLMLLYLLNSSAQAENRVFATVDWHQNNDYFNHGIIFSGYEFMFGYGYSFSEDEKIFDLETSFKFGINHGKEILGLNAFLNPVRIFYGKKVEIIDNIDTYAGFNLETFYQFSIYPDLHMGNDFWITNYSISPEVRANIEYGNGLIKLKLGNSVLGLLSRPDREKDPYYFSLRLGDIISDLHSNFKFGSFDLFNNLNFAADYFFDKHEPNFSVGYRFKFLNYYDNPEYDYLFHGLNFTYYWGGK